MTYLPVPQAGLGLFAVSGLGATRAQGPRCTLDGYGRCGHLGLVGVLGGGTPAPWATDTVSPTIAKYESAMSAYAAAPTEENYSVALAAYKADLSAWEQERKLRSDRVQANARSYSYAKSQYDRAMSEYKAAVRRREALQRSIAELTRAWEEYRAKLPGYQASAAGRAATNASRRSAYQSKLRAWEQAHEAWQSALQQWRQADAAYRNALSRRNQQLARLNQALYAEWGGSMPSSYDGCLTSAQHRLYQQQCDQSYVRGLGAWPSGAPVATAGAYRGVPVCLLAQLPVCDDYPVGVDNPGSAPREPTRPTPPTILPAPTAPVKPDPIPELPPAPVKPTAPMRAQDPPALRAKPVAPKPPPARASGGVSGAGLLLVVALVGGGYLGWKAWSKKKGAKP
jgi:tetratricopeptide (TPR) repeat protein